MDLPLPVSSPQFEEANEEAIGNLGLADAEEIVDQGLEMPEDVSLSSPRKKRTCKRNIDEVADSEDDEDTPHDSAITTALETMQKRTHQDG